MTSFAWLVDHTCPSSVEKTAGIPIETRSDRTGYSLVIYTRDARMGRLQYPGLDKAPPK